MKAGIVGYGVYIPRFRIKKDEYVKAWGSYGARGVDEKAVTGVDEDVMTMAVESSRNATKRANTNRDQLDGVFFASTSAPYSEKLLSSTIVAALNGSPKAFTADVGYSTKAGTTALLSCLDFVSCGRGDFALSVASDSPQAMPGDLLEHALGAGSASFIIGKDNTLVCLEGARSSCMEIIGERYRRQGERYLKDAGIAAYAEQAFNWALTGSVTTLLTDLGLKSDEFAYAVFQQFDGRSAYDIGRKMGFKDTQITPSMSVCKIGDTGCSSPLIGLCAVFDVAKQGDRILLASYGAGSGSDAVSLVATDKIEEFRNEVPLTETYISQKEYVDYITYLKFRRMLGAK
jgi:hydroxymethylglutaryl-CoA synthase